MVGCNFHFAGIDVGGAGGGGGNGGAPIPVADAGGTGGNGADDLGAYNGGVDFGPTGGAPCYSEDYSPTVSLADLRAAYATQQWKPDVLETLKRRIPGGHALIDLMQNDSQLGNFVDPSSFDALMSSLMMVCNGETSIYDYGHASPTAFTYFLRADLTLTPAIVPTFPRSEIAPYITDSATSAYDGALAGQQGQQDLTARRRRSDRVHQRPRLHRRRRRPGAERHQRARRRRRLALLPRALLEARAHRAPVDLRRAPGLGRLAEGGALRAGRAPPSGARCAAPSSQLGIADAPIWAHVDDPASSSEITAFTGSTLSDIECHP